MQDEEPPYPWFATLTMRLPSPKSQLSIDEHHDTIWKTMPTALESEANDEEISKGVPSLAMGSFAEQTDMSWEALILAGFCTPKYAVDTYILQLNNLTLVAVLLAGFAIGFTVDPPAFLNDGDLPDFVLSTIKIVYGLTMLFSGVSCFAATSIALHTVGRLSNALPSKSSTTYMTSTIFKPAKVAVQQYIFRGILAMVIGLTCAFMNAFPFCYGIPAFSVSAFLCVWFIFIYMTWEDGTCFHSEIADYLAAKDIAIAAKGNNSICEGLVQS